MVPVQVKGVYTRTLLDLGTLGDIADLRLLQQTPEAYAFGKIPTTVIHRSS